jgi:hypothetical protein
MRPWCALEVLVQRTQAVVEQVETKLDPVRIAAALFGHQQSEVAVRVVDDGGQAETSPLPHGRMGRQCRRETVQHHGLPGSREQFHPYRHDEHRAGDSVSPRTSDGTTDSRPAGAFVTRIHASLFIEGSFAAKASRNCTREPDSSWESHPRCSDQQTLAWVGRSNPGAASSENAGPSQHNLDLILAAGWTDWLRAELAAAR